LFQTLSATHSSHFAVSIEQVDAITPEIFTEYKTEKSKASKIEEWLRFPLDSKDHQKSWWLNKAGMLKNQELYRESLMTSPSLQRDTEHQTMLHALAEGEHNSREDDHLDSGGVGIMTNDEETIGRFGHSQQASPEMNSASNWHIEHGIVNSLSTTDETRPFRGIFENSNFLHQQLDPDSQLPNSSSRDQPLSGSPIAIDPGGLPSSFHQERLASARWRKYF